MAAPNTLSPLLILTGRILPLTDEDLGHDVTAIRSVGGLRGRSLERRAGVWLASGS